MKTYKFLLTVCFLPCVWNSVSAQSATLANGSDISGAGGSVSQSVGQVAYITTSNTTTTVSQGVQQTYLVTVETGLEQKQISLEASAYPNPTSDAVTLSISDMQLSGLRYSIEDVNGRQIAGKEIVSPHTAISLGLFANGNYFIKVYKQHEPIKTFKLIKTQ